MVIFMDRSVSKVQPRGGGVEYLLPLKGHLNHSSCYLEVDNVSVNQRPVWLYLYKDIPKSTC